MDDKIICSNCGTANEEKYIYCKNCGTQINHEGAERPNVHTAGNANYNYTNNDINIPDIDGVSPEEMAIFIGAKSRKILPKLGKMQVTRSKTSICWPVVILGYIFGPMGAALWFLYRKMYKVAILFFAIGIIISGAFSVAETYLSDGETVSRSDIFGIYTDYTNGEIGFDEYVKNINSLYNSTVAVSNMVDVAIAIFSGIFAYHWYKKFAVNKINKLRASNIDDRYYLFAISSSGGTSAGAVILGIVICLLGITLMTVAALILTVA